MTDMSPTERRELVKRLRAGAPKSLDIGSHLQKYQALCDMAADELTNLSRALEQAEAERETERIYFNSRVSDVLAERDAAEAERDALDKSHKALGKQLADTGRALEQAIVERDEALKTHRGIVMLNGEIALLLAKECERRKAAEAREARMRAAATLARRELGSTLNDHFGFWSAPQNAEYRRKVHAAWRTLHETLSESAPTDPPSPEGTTDSGGTPAVAGAGGDKILPGTPAPKSARARQEGD